MRPSHPTTWHKWSVSCRAWRRRLRMTTSLVRVGGIRRHPTHSGLTHAAWPILCGIFRHPSPHTHLLAHPAVCMCCAPQPWLAQSQPPPMSRLLLAPLRRRHRPTVRRQCRLEARACCPLSTRRPLRRRAAACLPAPDLVTPSRPRMPRSPFRLPSRTLPTRTRESAVLLRLTRPSCRQQARSRLHPCGELAPSRYPPPNPWMTTLLRWRAHG